MKSGCLIYDVMSHEVQKASPETLLVDIAKIMERKRVGSVVIIEGKKAVGIITEQDLARKAIAKGIDPNTTAASVIMNPRLITITSSRDVYDAAVVMQNSEIKHLPVMDKGKLVGIITAKDMIRLEPYLIEKISFNSSLSKDEAKKLFDGL